MANIFKRPKSPLYYVNIDSSPMDNRSIDVTSRGKEALGLALSFIWPNAAGGHATHYMDVRIKDQTKYYLDTSGKLETNTSSVCGDLSNVKLHTHHFTEHKVAEDGQQTLVLLWCSKNGEDKDIVRLPFKLDLEKAVDFCWGWLESADYGKESCWSDAGHERGFRVFTDYWGHVVGNWGAIVGVQPAWALLGK